MFEKDDQGRYKCKDRKKDGIVLPKPFSPSEYENLPFGMEKRLIKTMIQDAMNCCLASYQGNKINTTCVRARVDMVGTNHDKVLTQ